MKKEIILDEAAQELFKTLGGIDTSRRVSSSDPGGEDLSSVLGEEEARMDEWRTLLVEFVYRLAGHLRGLRLTGMTEQRMSERDDLFNHLSRLTRMPGRGDRMLLRYRGMLFAGDRKSGQESDYVLACGPVMVDIPVVKALVNRRGVNVSHLPGRLASAFELFSSMQISTLHISLKEWTDEAKKRMSLCLHGLGQYFVGISLSAGVPDYQRTQTGRPSTVVLDEHQRPDASLTMLAVVNGLAIETVQGLADKVSQLMHQPDADAALSQYANIYEAIFAFKNLREKLVRPPIEINNVRWIIAGRDEEIITREKAAVGRLVMEKFNDSPKKASLLIESIYGADFPDLGADALDARLGRVTDFLDEIEAGGRNEEVEKEVLDSVHDRLQQVPEEVFDNLSIGGAADEGPVAKAGAEGGRLHHNILRMVSFFKRRFGTRKKMRQMMHEPVVFDAQDYETIAQDFGIPLEDAKALVTLLRSSFDEKGRFLRPAFEKNIPAFSRYEKKVFEFLWHTLKEIKVREDRVAFLNSIQTLIAQMKQRRLALRIILNDFVRSPGHVSFSDRNALILANLLIRKYNKKLRMDIEISPEEVLRVKDGLDVDVVREIGVYLEENQGPLFDKIRTIHRKTKEMMDGRDNDSPIPVRYLLSLERECYIFLSLLGGLTAHRIMVGAVKEYGNPDSEIYHLTKSGQTMKGLIQLLRVTVRGLGRFAEGEDIMLLKEVKAAEAAFLALMKDESARYALAGVMKWIDKTIQ